jgi:hypothetical protein
LKWYQNAPADANALACMTGAMDPAARTKKKARTEVRANKPPKEDGGVR